MRPVSASIRRSLPRTPAAISLPSGEKRNPNNGEIESPPPGMFQTRFPSPISRSSTCREHVRATRVQRGLLSAETSKDELVVGPLDCRRTSASRRRGSCSRSRAAHRPLSYRTPPAPYPAARKMRGSVRPGLWDRSSCRACSTHYPRA